MSIKRFIGTILALSLAGASLAQTPQLNLARIPLSSGMYRMDVQVAQTPEQREIGLMFREHLGDNEGMLFVFEVPDKQCFWMKNTLVPLTAAFINDAGQIVFLADMQPQTLKAHCTPTPVRYVLEMPQGWFKRKHIEVGSKMQGEPFGTKANQ